MGTKAAAHLGRYSGQVLVRGIVGMGDIIPKKSLCGCHHTGDTYRFITRNRKFKIMVTSLIFKA